MLVYQFNNGLHNGLDASLNWGDILAHYIVSHLVGYRVEITQNNEQSPKLLNVGSVMMACRPADTVWGTGIIQPGGFVASKMSRDIRAVRGPLTRAELLRGGFRVPEIYGDPALLMKGIYDPEVEPEFEYGIIPHYVDMQDPGVRVLVSQGFKLINICDEVESFVRELKSCKRILSSSLHGLIAADVYGIPNARFKASGKIVGEDFKYLDYAKSVQRSHISAYNINAILTKSGFDAIKWNDTINFNGEALLEAFPTNKF